MSDAARPRLAVIGAGAWGRVLIRVARESDAVALTRVASRDPATVLPEGVARDEDWRTTLRAGDVDAVVVATPPGTHAEIALAALDAGLDVFIEKPLALTPADAEAVLSRAEQTGAAVLVDHVYLFHPAWAALKARVAAGGPVRGVDAAFGQRGPFRPDVGLLWDWGPHVVALCLDLFGMSPDEAALRVADHETVAGQDGETLTLVLRYGAATADLTVSNILPVRSRRFAVRLDGGTLLFEDGADTPLLWQPDDGPSEAVTVSATEPLDAAFEHFAAAIARRRAGEPAHLSALRLAVDTVRVLSGLDPCPA